MFREIVVKTEAADTVKSDVDNRETVGRECVACSYLTVRCSKRGSEFGSL